MYNYKRNIKKYPLIGGIIIFISLLIPAAYFEYEVNTGLERVYVYVYVWMFGLIYLENSGGQKITAFSQNLFFLVSSLVCSGLIIISAIKLIITAHQADDPNVDLFKLRKIWRNMSLIGIIVPFVWIGITGVCFSGFWDFFSPGLGLFGIVIGGIIALIGSQMKETPYYPYQEQQLQQYPARSVTTPVQAQNIARNIKYCIKCGQQIERTTKYCRYCGSEQH